MNLTFLSPSFLPALGAALLPILIHLLNRRRPKVIPFSNVAFLQELQQSRMRRMRLRQIVLLILRTLAVAMLVLAFARPTLKGVLTGGSGSTAAVLLLDRSYSMGYRTDDGRLLDLAKERAAEVLDTFDRDDTVWLFSFADTPARLDQGVQDLGFLQDQIRRIELTSRTTDAPAAVQEAAALLSSSPAANREVYLFTDMTRSGWPSRADSLYVGDRWPSIYLVSSSRGSLPNVSIDSARVREEILVPGRPITVDVGVTNRRDVGLSEMPVHLYINGQRVEQELLDVEAGAEGTVAFSYTPQRGGKLYGYVEIEEDRLPLDGRRYFTAEVPERIRVLLVGDASDDTYFLRQAFASGEHAVDARAVRSDQLSANELAETDVAILCNVSRLDLQQVRSVQQAVERGRGLVLCLGERVQTEFYNRELLPGLIGVRLGARMGGGPEAYYSFGRMNLNHPVLRNLTEDGAFDSPRVYTAYAVPAAPEVEAIVRYSSGGLALGGRGKVLLLTTALDLGWTDLPIRGLFVPLFHRMVQYLATDTSARTSYLVGQSATRRTARAAGEGAATCETPGGETFLLAQHAALGRGSDDAAEGIWKIGTVAEPGLWRLHVGETEIDRFAVNVDARESDLEPVSKERIERILNGPVHVVPPDAFLREAVLGRRYGRELWRSFLLLALALLFAELWIGRTRRDEVADEEAGGRRQETGGGKG